MRPAEIRRDEIIPNRKILHTLVQVSCRGYVAVFAGDPAFAAYREAQSPGCYADCGLTTGIR